MTSGSEFMQRETIRKPVAMAFGGVTSGPRFPWDPENDPTAIDAAGLQSMPPPPPPRASIQQGVEPGPPMPQEGEVMAPPVLMANGGPNLGPPPGPPPALAPPPPLPAIDPMQRQRLPSGLIRRTMPAESSGAPEMDLTEAPPDLRGSGIPSLAAIGGPPALPTGPPRPQMPPPPMPRTQRMYSEIDRLAQQKNPPAWRQALGAVLSASPRLRGVGSLVSGDAGRARDIERLKLHEYGANEEQQQAHLDIARQGAERQGAVATQRIATDKAREAKANRPAKTLPELIEEGRQAKDAQGNALFNDDQLRWWATKGNMPKPVTPERPVSVAPGATLVQPSTSKVLFTAPAKEATEKNPQILQLQDDATGDDPVKAARAKRILAADEARETRKIRAGAETRRDVQGNAPITPITPGTREFRIAQDLAYGKLTMPQFRSMTAYSRDTNKKMDIYDKAGELNPNFNAASFEMGFTLAKNPKVQQQLASMDNVQAGIPDLLKHSKAAKRTGITALNGIVTKGGVMLGGKHYSNFHTAQIGFADELSGALGFGSATDMSRQMGVDMTNGNLSPENFEAAIQDVVLPFIQRKRSTLLNQMGIYGQPGMNPAAGSPSGATPPPAGGGYKPGETRVIGGVNYVRDDKGNWHPK